MVKLNYLNYLDFLLLSSSMFIKSTDKIILVCGLPPSCKTTSRDQYELLRITKTNFSTAIPLQVSSCGGIGRGGIE